MGPYPHELVETMNYIAIEPIINASAVREYARQQRTEHPWVHVEATLKALSEIATWIEMIQNREIADMNDGDDAWAEIQRFVGEKHRDASNTFLSFFGGCSDRMDNNDHSKGV